LITIAAYCIMFSQVLW